MQNQKESILITLYNTEKYIAETIQLVLAQIWPKLKNIEKLKQQGKLKRLGSEKNEHWEVIL